MYIHYIYILYIHYNIYDLIICSKNFVFVYTRTAGVDYPPSQAVGIKNEPT